MWHITFIMKNYFIYKHIRTDKNTVFYIGIGKLRSDKTATTFKLKHYRAYSKQGRNPIWKAITNKTDYVVEIIETNVSKEYASKLEIELIKKYGKIKEKGLLANISNGGETVVEELITVLNDKKCSEKVYQYDLDGNLIKEWDSVKQAGEALGINRPSISNCLKGRYKSAGGFIWRYSVEEVSPVKKTKSIEQYDLDGNLIKVWDSINSIENGTDYKRKTIYACANGQNSTAYGYVWKYCR